jgi:hypothetical protein
VQSGAWWGVGAREWLHALCALGGSVASNWHGQAAMHSGSRTRAARGIDRGCSEGLVAR